MWVSLKLYNYSHDYSAKFARKRADFYDKERLFTNFSSFDTGYSGKWAIFRRKVGQLELISALCNWYCGSVRSWVDLRRILLKVATIAVILNGGAFSNKGVNFLGRF